jgi:hypothetical protein
MERRYKLGQRLVSTAVVTGLLVNPVIGALAAGQSVQLPSVDISSLGQLGVVGQFDGISTYEYKGQQYFASGLLSGVDALIAQQENNVFVDEGQLDGIVFSSCALEGVVYYGGNFTKTGDVETAGVGCYNASSGEILALPNGPNGTINVLYCNSNSSEVYVGGDFTFNNGSSIAVWSTKNQKWSLPAFGGFTQGAHINAITSFGQSIIFGGAFSGLQNSSLLGINGTVGEQLVTFNGATAYAFNGASGQNENNLLCPNGGGWRVLENAQGSWGVNFNFTFDPTRIRLYNLNDDSNGVKTFRLITTPSNGIMNLTYVDPSSGKTVACDAYCPLPQYTDQPYMDFEFVNVVETDGFQIFLLDFYGDQSGLEAVELFQYSMVTYAINEFNEPKSCQGGKTSGGSVVSGEGWAVTTDGSTLYLETTIDDSSELSNLTVTFKPNITDSGNYTVQLFTPGCTDDGTCSTRGGANVTVYPAANQDPVSTILYQTNDFDKYDTVFSGIIDPSNGYDVRVEMAPVVPVASTPITFVAQKVQWVLTSNVTNEINIQNLFEFNPDNFTGNANVTVNGQYMPIGDTAINQAGPSLGNSAVVNALYGTSDTLFIGGSFTISQGSNLVAVSQGAQPTDPFSRVASGGLNGTVTSITQINEQDLSIIGDFGGTANGTESGLGGIAFYDTSSQKWTALGGGVSGGSVHFAVPVTVNDTQALAVSGNFTEVLANNTSAGASGFCLFLLSENTWQPMSSLELPVVNGSLSSESNYGNGTLYFGGLQITDSAAPGAITLDGSLTTLSPPPFSFADHLSYDNATNTTASRGKRNTGSLFLPAGNTINTAVFVNNTLSVYGGAFTATDSNGKLVNDVILVNGSQSFGLPNNPITSDSVVYAVYTADSRLYIGGSLTATVNGNAASGIMFFDLDNQTYPTQPPGINGGESLVTYIGTRPSSNDLIVMGSFDQAGGLGCPSFCVYDLDANRWNAPTSGLSGLVSSAVFLDTNTLFFAGQISLNDSSVYFGQYDFSTSAFSTDNDLSTGLPGPVNSFVINGEGTSSMFASGTNLNSSSAFLAYWNNSAWTFIDSVFSTGTVITGLSILPLLQGHSENGILPTDELLVVTGSIVLQDFGNASTVMYDGSSWQPLFITTAESGSGIVSSVFAQNSKSFSSLLGKTYMARGFVVLVSLAIAVGLILLIILLGLLAASIRKRRQGYRPAPTRINEEQMTQTVPPENLFSQFGHK